MESVFAAAFLILVFLKANGPGKNIAFLREAALDHSLSSVPLLLTLLFVAITFSGNLRDPFLSDDYVLVSGTSLGQTHLLAALLRPAGDGSYRPVGYLYYGLVRMWAGYDPARWHIVALAIHLVNCTFLYLIVRALWRHSLLASLSALLFGSHGTRPEVVTWTAGNYDLLACGFTLAAVFCVLRTARPSYGAMALSLCCILMAVLSKESAYVAPAAVWAFAIAGDRSKDRRLRLFVVAASGLCILLFVHRWYLFGGPGGYTDSLTGRPQILSLKPLLVAKALSSRIWDILLFPVNWEAASGSRWLAAGILIGGAAVLSLVYARVGIPFRIVSSLAGLTICAVLPAIHLALIGRSAFGSRILYLPSVGFCVLLGHLAMAAGSTRHRISGAACLVFSSALALAYNLQAWHNAALVADQLCSAAARSTASDPAPVPLRMLRGVVVFPNGFPQCIAMKGKP